MKTFQLLTEGILLILLLFSCSPGAGDSIRAGQDDDTAPYFMNLNFPQYITTIPEGELLISGTLVDDLGFDIDKPIILRIRIVPYPASPQYNLVYDFHCKNPDTQEYTFFDFNTGEFQIRFGPERRMKPGIFELELTGRDSSGNVSAAHIATVISTDIEGLNGADLQNARRQYGLNLVRFLNSYKHALIVYGEEYQTDIRIVDMMIEFVFQTYVVHPIMSEWGPYIDQLYNRAVNFNYPDPVIQGAINVTALDFKDNLDAVIRDRVSPLYPRHAARSDIIDGRREQIIKYSDAYLINEKTGQNGELIIDFQVDCIVPFENIPQTILDFTVISHPENPEEPLSVTGTIGYGSSVKVIEPSDYDPPIKLFNSMWDAGIIYGHLVKQY